MWESVDVEIVQEVALNAISPFENADANDGILLNHDYVDMRGGSGLFADCGRAGQAGGKASLC